MTRRQALGYAGGIAAAGVVGRVRGADKSLRAEVLSTRVISKLTHRYHGWPTLARRANGQLVVVCSGGRETHVCPFGRVEMITSNDDGKSWTWPRVLLDGAIDDRDAGVVETAQGSLLVTTFTSLAYERTLKGAKNWSKEKLARWRAAHTRANEQQRQKELGVWMIRSTDGGLSWSARIDCGINSPHGPIQLSDGRVLYVGKELWRGKRRNGVRESKDDGKTWSWLAEIPTREGDAKEQYHELHAVETADGRIIAQIRNHNKTNFHETLQTESSDGGKSWSMPHSIGVWGYPSHLLRLKNDRLVMSYGHRRAPLGVQSRVSSDHGRTWSDPLVVAGDGRSGDLGYPSTVELDDGTLVTVWYENMAGSDYAVLRQAHWRIVEG